MSGRNWSKAHSASQIRRYGSEAMPAKGKAPTERKLSKGQKAARAAADNINRIAEHVQEVARDLATGQPELRKRRPP